MSTDQKQRKWIILNLNCIQLDLKVYGVRLPKQKVYKKLETVFFD